MASGSFLKQYLDKHTNAVIRYMTLADFAFYAGVQLLGPIFALFIVSFIEGGNAEVAGIAAAIYLVTKSLFQAPVGFLIDKIAGERDDYIVMFIGTMVGSLLPLLYLVIDTPLELYVVQFFLGLSFAAMFPSFMAIFTRHVNAGKEASAWSFYYTLLDIGMAVGAAVGGYYATRLGFEAVIVASCIISFLGCIFYLPVRSHLRMARK